MTVIRERRFADSAIRWFDFMGRRCYLEVSGVERGFGLAVFEFHYTTAEVCFAWRRARSGVELFETDECKRYCWFLGDWESAFWRSNGIRRLLKRPVREVVLPS